jgi:hypothetical protein
MEFIAILAASFLMIGVFVAYRRSRSRAHFHAVFGGRPELSAKDAVQAFRGTGTPEEVSGRLLGAVARFYSVPVGQLRPGDRFDRELRVPPVVEFLDMTPPSRVIPAILLEFSGRNRDAYPDFKTMPDVAAISTLEDFVRLAGREISGGRGGRAAA